MKRFALPLIAAAGLALSACASLAPYGAQTGPAGQGYSEQRIESNRFRVTYNGVGGENKYNKITKMDGDSGSCESTPQSYSGSMSPLDEEVRDIATCASP